MKQFFLPCALCHSQKHLPVNELQVPRLSGNNQEELQNDDLPGFRVKSDIKKHLYSELGQTNLLHNEAGWDRLRILFAFQYPTGFIQEDVHTMNTIMKRIVIISAVFNLFSATSHATKKVVNSEPQHQSTIRNFLMEPSLRKNVIKETAKSTFRVACFSSIIIYLSQSIAAYRNKSAMWEYGIATAIAFVYKDLAQGLTGVFRSGAVGALLGIAGGYLTCSVLSMNGWSQEQRNLPRRMKYLSLQNSQRSDQ
ncbi:hypothetical protein Btru_054778 [Bulinus truncatus]|nr:hypothetical protein Btru_054778 [Bulinus truncatus]